MPPLASVTSVKYPDSAGTQTTLAASEYTVDTAVTPGRLFLKYGHYWPVTILQPHSAVVVRFVAGFGAASAVPEDLRQALLLLVGHFYENREAVIPQSGVSINPAVVPLAYDSMILEYRNRARRF